MLPTAEENYSKTDDAKIKNPKPFQWEVFRAFTGPTGWGTNFLRAAREPLQPSPPKLQKNLTSETFLRTLRNLPLCREPSEPPKGSKTPGPPPKPMRRPRIHADAGGELLEVTKYLSKNQQVMPEKYPTKSNWTKN